MRTPAGAAAPVPAAASESRPWPKLRELFVLVACSLKCLEPGRDPDLELTREHQSFDAALVSLDLALVLAKHERRRELLVLVDGMITTFRRLKIQREGFAALILLRRVCQRPVFEAEALSARIRATAALLTRQPH